MNKKRKGEGKKQGKETTLQAKMKVMKTEKEKVLKRL